MIFLGPLWPQKYIFRVFYKFFIGFYRNLYKIPIKANKQINKKTDFLIWGPWGPKKINGAQGPPPKKKRIFLIPWLGWYDRRL